MVNRNNFLKTEGYVYFCCSLLNSYLYNALISQFHTDRSNHNMLLANMSSTVSFKSELAYERDILFLRGKFDLEGRNGIINRHFYKCIYGLLLLKEQDQSTELVGLPDLRASPGIPGFLNLSPGNCVEVILVIAN